MTRRDNWRASIGRRGAALLILAAGDLAYGLALLAGYAPATIATDIEPAATWGTLWIVAALILTAGALSAADQIGFAVAALIKFAWAGMIFADLGGESHARGGWGPAVPWLILAALILLMAGWPETPR